MRTGQKTWFVFLSSLTPSFSDTVHSELIDEWAKQSGDLYIRSICFSPNGRYLVTGAEDNHIRVRYTLHQHRLVLICSYSYYMR